MTITAILFAALWPAAASAQIAVDPAALESVQKTGDAVASRLAPAKADPKIFESLVDRLMKQGGRIKTALGPAMAFQNDIRDEVPYAPSVVTAILFGGELPQRSVGDPKRGIVDLALRYAFSHMQVGRVSVSRLADGVQIDGWDYILGMDGSILSSSHTVRVRKAGKPDQVVVVELDPRDPAVVQRWKQIEKQLPRLGPTVEI